VFGLTFGGSNTPNFFAQKFLKFPFLYTPGGISGRPAGILFGKKNEIFLVYSSCL
jgi:hypothetical protein